MGAKIDGAELIVHLGQGLMFSLSGKAMMLLASVIFRALFHSQQSQSVLR